MKRILILFPLLLCGCSPTPTIEDAIDVAVTLKVAIEYELDYYYSKTNLIKYNEPFYIYHTDYIGVDEYHTYYSFEFLTAIENKEIIQIVEVKQ